MNLDVSPVSSLLPAAHPSLYEDDDGAEDAEAQKLQKLLAEWLQTRKEAEQKKGSKILEELQGSIEACLKKAEGQFQKEVKETQSACEKEFKSLKSQMAAKYDEIAAITEKYNVDISKAWADYNALYGKLEDVKAEAGGVVEKRRAGLKRKISQAQTEIGGLMAEAEKKLVKCKAQRSKMPGVLKMFQQML